MLLAGLDTTFLPQGGERAAAYLELLQAAQAACPQDALVGYESGEALHRAGEAGGFTPVGLLRVWVRRPG